MTGPHETVITVGATHADGEPIYTVACSCGWRSMRWNFLRNAEAIAEHHLSGCKCQERAS